MLASGSMNASIATSCFARKKVIAACSVRMVMCHVPRFRLKGVMAVAQAA
jgi:hypothetical protein